MDIINSKIPILKYSRGSRGGMAKRAIAPLHLGPSFSCTVDAFSQTAELLQITGAIH